MRGYEDIHFAPRSRWLYFLLRCCSGVFGLRSSGKSAFLHTIRRHLTQPDGQTIERQNTENASFDHDMSAQLTIECTITSFPLLLD